MKKLPGYLVPVASLCIPLFIVVGCGGGGGGGSDSTGTPSNNAFASTQGDYASGCSVSPSGGGSESYTLTIGALHGTDSADFSFSAKAYTQSGCVDANKKSDVTITGTFKNSATTKTISTLTAYSSAFSGGLNKSGTAKIVDVGISGTAVAKWSGSFPFNVLTARVGYLVEGSNIYFLVNPIYEADGIGAYFSPIYLTKK